MASLPSASLSARGGGGDGGGEGCPRHGERQADALPAGSFLVAVDRRALPVWSAMLGAALVGLEAEAGEHVRLARLSSATPVGPFERFRMPVELRFAARAVDDRVFGELTELARRHGAGDVWLLPLRRHARLYVEHFAAWRSAQILDGDARRVLCIALSDAEGYAGVSLEPGERLFPPGTWQVGTGAKLADAVRQLDACGIAPRFCGTWIELGAFPGGMTRVLLERGVQHVVAVDRNPPNALLTSQTRVTYRCADACDAALPPGAAGLVCDINGPPELALRAATRAAGHLDEGAVVIHTIKLRRWSDAGNEIARATAGFAGAGVRCVAVRHLPANKQELAWLGCKTAALAVGEAGWG